MKKYLFFGSGFWGKLLLDIVGKENVAGFIDNMPEKWGTLIQDIPVMSLSDVIPSINDYTLVITVSQEKEGDIITQLKENGITEFDTVHNLREKIIKDRIATSRTNLGVYNMAIKWIKSHTIDGHAIINSTTSPKPYPEVTGYYIPTLLNWGYRDLAVAYAEWLCEIQKQDGSWFDTDDEAPYVFDTGQILKGLIAIRELKKDVDDAIIKGCDWILSNINEDGRLTTPTVDAWGDNGQCSELIHLYCLSPLREAASIFGKKEYAEAADRVLSYYKKNHYSDILNFNFLSHFYAYVMEALCDLGEMDMARQAMDKVALLQKESGAVPAYRNVDWICSTGLFQFALVWYKLGDVKRGNKAFEYACKLQNESGGWYGSYLSENNMGENNDYFPFGEISWAVKYFLDALSEKNKAEFEEREESFLDEISDDSGLLKTIVKIVQEKSLSEPSLKVLDVGCGKGRYLKKLISLMPNNVYYAVDISNLVMKHIDDDRIEKKQGTLTRIPYPDGYFDVVYACESLEHAVDIDRAIGEMCRVLKKDGKIVVIDKDMHKYGVIEIEEWEQWFEKESLREIIQAYCKDAEVISGVPNYPGDDTGIFNAWIGTK